MTSLKRVFLPVLAGILLLHIAHAQGKGTVEGRLVNATNPANPPAKVAFDVMSLAGGMNVLKSAATDAAGKFRLEGLPTDGPLLIRAAFGGVNYFSQAAFDSSGKAQVEIQVYESTTSLEGITVDSAQIAFKLGAGGLNSLESYSIRNQTRPPRSFMREDGNFRFSKAPGILQVPSLSVTGPGTAMPVNQSALESADGQSYYSTYPLRPGTTLFEVSEALPYQNGGYTLRKRFYQDIPALNIGVTPRDMRISGDGIKKVQENEAENFTVYSAGPIKAGTEVAWTFSGGTPIAEAPEPAAAPPVAPEGSGIRPMPTLVAQNAIFIGVLLLAGFLVILWFAYNRMLAAGGNDRESHARELKERRDHLLDYVVSLDRKHESQAIGAREYQRLREQAKRHLRRIAMVLGKK